MPLLDAGALLRAAMAAGTPLGVRAQAMMAAGARVPDDIVLGVLEQRLARPDARAGFILTNYPHDPAQAGALDAMLARLGRPIDAAVQLEGDESRMRERPDDDAVLARLDELQARQALLADYYRARGKLTALAQLPSKRGRQDVE